MPVDAIDHFYRIKIILQDFSISIVYPFAKTHKDLSLLVMRWSLFFGILHLLLCCTILAMKQDEMQDKNKLWCSLIFLIRTNNDLTTLFVSM